jgi:hypothetical protein
MIYSNNAITYSPPGESETTMKKTDATKTASKPTTIKPFNFKVNLKTDFSETLEITRTLFKNKISKTSIVEASLACSAAAAPSMTVTQIAAFIIKKLNVDDCFHVRESNKSKDIQRSTILRVRHHVIDTVKTHHKADKLYAYIKSTDSVSFTEKYHKLCKTNKVYRKRVAALLTKVKIQYKISNAVKKVS